MKHLVTPTWLRPSLFRLTCQIKLSLNEMTAASSDSKSSTPPPPPQRLSSTAAPSLRPSTCTHPAQHPVAAWTWTCSRPVVGPVCSWTVTCTHPAGHPVASWSLCERQRLRPSAGEVSGVVLKEKNAVKLMTGVPHIEASWDDPRSVSAKVKTINSEGTECFTLTLVSSVSDEAIFTTIHIFSFKLCLY